MNKFGLLKFSFENINCFYAYKCGYDADSHVKFEITEYLEARAYFINISF